MKKFFSCIIVMMASVAVLAVPAKRGWQTRTLSDGTQVELQLMGDEFYHYWTTRDGKIAVEQADGRFVVTNEDQPTAKKAAARRAAGQSRRKGSVARRNYGDEQPSRVLVILVNFSDQSLLAEHNAAFFDTIMNGSYPSVRDYFTQSSNGQYTPHVDLYGPYTLPHNTAYYGGNDSGSDDSLPGQMVIDACAMAYAEGCDFSNYDANNDDIVDNIYILYAGLGEAAGGTKNTIWPHSWELKLDTNYVSGTITYNGKTLNHYACSAELRKTFYSTTAEFDGIGTFCHEFSHVIGLPDYYDTDDSRPNNDNYTPGDYTLMDGGSYNGNGFYPPLYSAYDKYFMGWSTPKLLAKDGAGQNIQLTTTFGDAYQINGDTSLVECTDPNTVYYIENRQQQGYDTYIPGHGMLIWEVTYDDTRWDYNDLNNYYDLRYTLLPANENSSYISSDDTPFPGTMNVTDITPIDGCELSRIAEQYGIVTFRYNGGELDAEYIYELSGSYCTVPEDGFAASDNPLILTITPDEGYTLDMADCWLIEMDGEILVYGKDYSYNAATNELRIERVIGDITILAEAKQIFSITWYAKSETFATSQSAGTLTLPVHNPEACSANRVFMGWSTIADYESADVAPTFAKDGDSVSVGTNYYAIYATTGNRSKEQKMIYLTPDSVTGSYGTDTEKTRCGITCYFTNVMKTTGKPIQIQMKKNGSYIANKTELGKIDSVVIAGTTNLTVYAGTEEKPSNLSITPDGHNYDFSAGDYSYFTVMNNNTNVAYANSIKIYYREAGGYCDYSTNCETQKYTVRFYDKGELIDSQELEYAQTATLPADPTPTCADYSFAGWWTEELDADNTEAKSWINDFTVDGNQDYYAVYSKTIAGGGINDTYSPITSTSDLTTGEYLVVGSYSNKLYAMKNALVKDYYIGQKQVSTTGNDIICTDGTIIWQITVNGDSLSFYNQAIGKYVYLYQSGTYYDLGLTDDTADNIYFTYSLNAGSWDFVSTVLTAQHLEYYGKESNFSAYKQAGDPIYLYKQQSADLIYYSTSLNCTPTGCEQVKATEQTHKMIENGQIIILRGTEKYNLWGQRVK